MRIGSTLFLLGQKLKMVKNCCKQVKKEKYSKIQPKTKDVLSELEHIQFALLTCPDSNLLCEEFQAQKHGLSLPEFRNIFSNSSPDFNHGNKQLRTSCLNWNIFNMHFLCVLTL